MKVWVIVYRGNINVGLMEFNGNMDAGVMILMAQQTLRIPQS